MIASLQSLRFIFAIMIFLHHYPVNGEGLFHAGGSCGVSFFMILSGFVMSAGYLEKVASPDFKKRPFLLKRLARLYPLHLLCLVGFLCIHISGLTGLDYVKLLPNALLFQSWIPINSIYFSGNAVSWCLSDMLFFYAMFPILAKCLKRFDKKIGLRILGLLLLYLIVVVFMPEPYWHPFLYISPVFRLIDFVIGMLTYKFYVQLKEANFDNKIISWSFSKKSLIEILLALLLLAAIMLVPYIDRKYYYALLWWFIMPEIILSFALFNKTGGVISILLSQRCVVFAGEFSFTFYMIHQMGIGVLHSIFNKLGLSMLWEVELLVCFVLILLVSYFVYRYYEVPISNYLRKKI